MSIVITPNDYTHIGELFGELAISSPLDGFDLLLYTRRGKIPLERKAIPGDLIASVTDGRLARELRAMREVSKFYILLLHGRFTFRQDGTLVIPGAKRAGRDWTRKGIRNLLRTIQYVEGAFIEQAESDEELVEVVTQIEDYFNKSQHLSLRIRPGLQSNWILPTRDEKVMHFYQGLPGISTIRARSLIKQYPSPMGLYAATIDDLMSISGVGRTIAKGIYDFLREG